ncbi:MAG: N-6 DNA methylase, partial [Nitrospirae bacterium]|nr:N-6 DNA methylase [Nitrospirota bacterium]
MPRKQEQYKLSKNFWITTGVFSSHYLLERLPQAGPKLWPSDEEVSLLFKAIQNLYKANIIGLRKGNEANTERRFIDKVFDELGYGFLNQNQIPEAERRQVPDYFLYSSRKDADKAFELSSHMKYKSALSIAEAKRWDHNLDKPSSGKGKAPGGRYPHQQIRDYLNESEHIKWGILTNGKEWRLYFKEGRSSKFFEIDIEECLEDLQRFKYFHVLFSPLAFIKNSSGRCLLDNILDESLRFQEDIEKDLRVKVFKCVEWLGHGFLSREENHLSEKDLDAIYHHSLILLYRILFVFNAEARDLLPTNPLTKYYKHYGFQRIKDMARQEKGEFISAKTVLYDELLALFHLINGSNEKLNKDMNIPRYNGGLFDPERYKFLEEKKVGDDVISEIIYELSYRADNGEIHSIDYKGLGERHLGTIYEGLLEHKFSFADSRITLKNDKGERKATGAYYTPDYIVKYIVENTLGPIIKKIDEELYPTLKKGGMGGFSKDDSFAKEVLKLNICDPAMGSGHFLVEAVQFLADEIAYHPTTELKTPKSITEDEINYWKRKVVESCIYGVDIKELAVELAKLSLWLKTVDRSQPLNFLDHHLRCGNSLIGARISNLNYLPSSKRKNKKSEEQDEQAVLFDKSQFTADITTVIKGFHSIEDMPSEKISDIKAKEKTFQKLMEELVGYKEIADLWTSLYFGNNLEEKERAYEELLQYQYKYQRDLFGSDSAVVEKKKSKAGLSNRIYNFIVDLLQRPDGKTQMPKLGSLLENSETIAKDKMFFHWELTFPEVFFNENGSPKKNPGFDCVIGNPPYDAISEIEQEKDVQHEKEYFSQQLIYVPAIGSKLNLYRLFSVISLDLLNSKGMHGFIVPMALLADKQAKPLREFILKKNSLQKIEAFPQKDDPANRVFPDAKLSTCIYILCKQKPSLFDVRIHPGRDILETSTFLTIKQSQIEEFDKDNLSIPSYPNMTTKDFNLALRLNKISNGIMLKHFAPSQQGEVNLTSHS